MKISAEIEIYFDGRDGSDLYLYASSGEAEGATEDLTFDEIFDRTMRMTATDASDGERAEFIGKIRESVRRFLERLEREV
ncbi:MAG: hypothetical protein WA584_23600 [Pyrinomonadaceae bacterium]